VAERLEASWITLDLDDDDAALATAGGDVEAAGAYERLLAVFGPLFDGLTAASLLEAEAIGERHGLVVEHVPNAVALPARLAARSRPNHRDPSLLFVGNLTYRPNVEAAWILVEDVLPRLRRRLARRVTVTLVGPHHPELERLAGPDVELAGFVPDLAPVYASADVVVVPLRTGGGTRIKLLEAFTHGVPVVASPAAAAGLEVSDGRHLLLAEDAERAAAAVEAIVTDEATARRLTAEAGRLVRDRYQTDAVIPVIRGFFSRAGARARGRLQPSGSG
jgi:glycosyltransferase involved in cell wall biosynthesis